MKALASKKILSQDEKNTVKVAESLKALNKTPAWEFIKQYLLDARQSAETSIDLTLSADEVKIAVAINQFKREFIVGLQDQIKDAIEDGQDIIINNS